MTSNLNTRDLSRVELVVLARLSGPKPLSESDMFEDVLKLVFLGEAPAQAKLKVQQILSDLREQGLATSKPRRRGSPLWSLTEDGSRVLQDALGVRPPAWRTIRDSHLPALALGLTPGSKQATDVLRNGESIAAAVLRAKFELPEGATLIRVCDAMIAEVLGMPPGPLDLKKIRAYVFERRTGVDPKGKLEESAKRVAVADVRAANSQKTSLTKALGRRWVQTNGTPARDATSARAASLPEAPQQPVAVQPPVASSLGQVSSGSGLLSVVREALPSIGADGRFGPEKVFVSAIWHRIERERQIAGMSLDRFKRWLLTANRDGLLVLVRADLVGAMDARLVAESEIEDQGDTFHFILDQWAGASQTGRSIHAR